MVWSQRHSRPVRVATLRLPVQTFDAAEQLRLADSLRFNPWHALPEHRPLGNQNRARRTIYATLADVRQRMNATPHVEPTEQRLVPVRALRSPHLGAASDTGRRSWGSVPGGEPTPTSGGSARRQPNTVMCTWFLWLAESPPRSAM